MIAGDPDEAHTARQPFDFAAFAVGQSLGDETELDGITISAAGTVDAAGVGDYTLSGTPTSNVGASGAPVVLWLLRRNTR